jgi:hypothetical protein
MPGDDGWKCGAFVFRHSFAISPRVSREFAISVPPSPIRKRGECRMPDAPAASCAHDGQTGQITLSALRKLVFARRAFRRRFLVLKADPFTYPARRGKSVDVNGHRQIVPASLKRAKLRHSAFASGCRLVCGQKGADVRPNISWNARGPISGMGYRIIADA